MYSSDYCGFCFKARRLLESKGVSVKEINVDGNFRLREEMVEKSGRYTVPQIWIGEKHIGGCDDLFRLEHRDELDLLLNINT